MHATTRGRPTYHSLCLHIHDASRGFKRTLPTPLACNTKTSCHYSLTILSIPRGALSQHPRVSIRKRDCSLNPQDRPHHYIPRLGLRLSSRRCGAGIPTVGLASRDLHGSPPPHEPFSQPAALAPDDPDTFIVQLSKLKSHELDRTDRCTKSIGGPLRLSHWLLVCRCELVRVILYSCLPPRSEGLST
jgi:hypothetical protein